MKSQKRATVKLTDPSTIGFSNMTLGGTSKVNIRPNLKLKKSRTALKASKSVLIKKVLAFSITSYDSDDEQSFYNPYRKRPINKEPSEMNIRSRRIRRKKKVVKKKKETEKKKDILCPSEDKNIFITAKPLHGKKEIFTHYLIIASKSAGLGNQTRNKLELLGMSDFMYISPVPDEEKENYYAEEAEEEVEERGEIEEREVQNNFKRNHRKQWSFDELKPCPEQKYLIPPRRKNEQQRPNIITENFTEKLFGGGRNLKLHK